MSEQKFGNQTFEDQHQFEAHQADVLALQPLRFEVLGPVRAFRGPVELALGPVRQRAVLAVLLLRQGVTCSAAEIIAAVWGHRPPRTSVGLVRTYVSRLRRVLGPQAISSDAAGYLMRVAPDELDVTSLERLLDRARQACRASDRARIAPDLRDVLARWTGPALDEIPGPFAQAQRTRFAELRCEVIERCVGAELADGGAEDSLPLLRAAVSEHPSRERLVGLLMIALYRSGRQADALTVFRELRERLFTAHGSTPGTELTALHAAVLRSDRRLANLRRDWRTVVMEPGLPDLPPDPLLVVGREHEVDHLLADGRADAPGPLLVAIDGVAGAGKTALALHVAHRLAEHYPDGPLFLDLGRHPDGPLTAEAALHVLLRAAGSDPREVAADLASRTDAWRELLADRRMLLVLDDAEGIEQVRPLLPDHPGCCVIVTSRTSLAALGATRAVSVPDVTDAATVELQELVDGYAALKKAGSYLDAESQLHRALDVAERSGPSAALPLIHVELALMRHYQGHSAQSLTAAREALRLANRLGNRRVAAMALNLVGHQQLALDDLHTGAESLRAAHVAAVEIADRPRAALALGALGAIAQRSGDLQAAFDLHDRAVGSMAGADPLPVSVELALRLADTHRAAGGDDHAEALLRSCLELAEQTADLLNTARALRGLARCLPASSEAQLYNARATAILRRLGVHDDASRDDHAADGSVPPATFSPGGTSVRTATVRATR